MTQIAIDAAFDSGNIEVLSIHGSKRAARTSPRTHQRICAMVSFPGDRRAGEEVELKLTGLNDSAYPAVGPAMTPASPRTANTGRAPLASFDKDEDGGTLTIRYTPASGTWPGFAYFAPYSMERHHDLVAEAAASEGVDSGAPWPRRSTDAAARHARNG